MTAWLASLQFSASTWAALGWIALLLIAAVGLETGQRNRPSSGG